MGPPIRLGGYIFKWWYFKISSLDNAGAGSDDHSRTISNAIDLFF